MKRAVALLVAAAGGCVVAGETSEVGKPCPCSETYECDQTTGTCRVPVSCSPQFSVQDFHAKWTTPESIRWDWVPLGDAAYHSSYRVIVGRNLDDVASGTGDVMVFDARINPELGGYDIPDQSGFELVSFTTTDGLSPATDFYGRLEVRDSAGCTFSTEPVKATTQPAPTHSVAIFDEELSGYASPCGMTPTLGCGLDGSACLKCSAQDSGLGRCIWDVDNPNTSDNENGWDNLYFVSQLDLAELDADAFASGRAFLELEIGVRSSTPVYYSEVDFIMRGEGCVDELGVCADYIDECLVEGKWFRRGGLIIRPRAEGYDKLQIPLSQFANDLGPMTRDRFVSPLLSGLRLGASFLYATEVDIDSITVRW
ncbi:MAG: hypothetical protein HOV80_16925 [Polyangiaceae bacterium]|nr:hypothetical protein [Polyangiaceae bacterium]